MRIGFFVWEYPPRIVGGLGTYAQYMAPEFVRRGHDVVLFTLNPGNLKTKEVIQGVVIHRPLIADASNIFPLFVVDDIKGWGRNIKVFNDILLYNILSSTKFLNDLTRKEGYEFDLMAVHDWLSSIAGLTIKNSMDIPLVFHVHSTERGRSNDRGSQVVSYLESTTSQVAERIITVSYAMKEDLSRHGWPESKIGVVWNGVDPEKYNPERIQPVDVERVRSSYRLGPEEKMILFVGRLTPVKGVMNLVMAMPLIKAKHPEAKLVILGTGEEQKDITDLARRLMVEDSVIYQFQFLPEEERIRHYAAADVCIFPSTYEPFGIVSLEAMAMGKPLVVGARGVVGFREQVLASGPDQNGVHVNGHDPHDIAWGIQQVLDDPERSIKWGENGRRRVLQYFTWEKTVGQTLGVYRELVKEKQ